MLLRQIAVVPTVIPIEVIAPMAPVDPGLGAVVPIVVRVIELPVPIGCIGPIFLLPPAVHQNDAGRWSRDRRAAHGGGRTRDRAETEQRQDCRGENERPHEMVPSG